MEALAPADVEVRTAEKTEDKDDDGGEGRVVEGDDVNDEDGEDNGGGDVPYGPGDDPRCNRLHRIQKRSFSSMTRT